MATMMANNSLENRPPERLFLSEVQLQGADFWIRVDRHKLWRRLNSDVV